MNSERVAWLEQAYTLLRAELLPGAPEQVCITVGFPSTKPRRVLGQCIVEPIYRSNDGPAYLTISPTIFVSAIEVLGTELHEMIHAADPEAGHGARFRKAMKAVGLEGKPTATTVGERLEERLNALLTKLPEFATIEMTLADRRKQSTRLLLMECECPRKIRLSQATADEGTISCGVCGGEFALKE